MVDVSMGSSGSDLVFELCPPEREEKIDIKGVSQEFSFLLLLWRRAEGL